MDEIKKEDFKKPELSAPGEVKKQTFWSKLTESFTGSDSKKIGEYLVLDILVPALKKTVQELVTNGTEMILYGNIQPRSRQQSNIPRVSYNTYYESDRRRGNDRYSDYDREDRVSYDRICFRTATDAIAVWDSIEEWIQRYGYITIATYKELSHASKYIEFTDNNYGWREIRCVDNDYGHRLYYSRGDDYYLILPRPYPINEGGR